MPTRTRLRRFAAEETGAVAIIVGLMLTVLIGCVAIGVDLSSLYVRQKSLQTQADLAAVSAVSHLSDTPEGRARATLSGNGLDDGALTAISYAKYSRNAALPPEARLSARDLTDSDVNAASVSVSTEAPLFFASSFLAQDSTPLSATATAARFDFASFGLGSRLLSLNEGLLNALLSAALGSEVSLSLLDYQALADAQIDLLTFTDLLANRISLTAAPYDEILTTQIDLLDILGALLDASAVDATTDVLTTLLNAATSSLLGAEELIAIDGDDVDVQLEDILPRITVSALDLLMASVDIVNADRIIDTSLDLDIPGLLDTELELVVGERPAGSGWITLGERGATLHTAQVRMRLDLTLEPSLLEGVDEDLNIVSVNLPVYLEIASSTATLSALHCSAVAEDDVLASFDTGIEPLDGVTGNHVAELFLGSFDSPTFEDTTTPLDAGDLDFAKLLGLRIDLDLLNLFSSDVLAIQVALNVKAHAAIGTSLTEQLDFTLSELGETKTFGSGDLLTSTVSSLLASLDTDVDVEVGLLDLGLIDAVVDGVLQLVTLVLQPILVLVLTPLDSVLDTVLATLGIGIGEADLTLHDVQCGAVMLVR